MKNSRINSYVLKEVLTPATLSLLAFTALLVMGRLPDLTKMVVNKGVALLDIGKLFCFLLPNILIITIPLAFLLGTLLAFGRLSGDSEFIALKASGISLYALVKPVLLLATAFTLLNAGLILYGKPAGNTALHDLLFEIAAKQAGIGIEPGIFNDSFEDLILYTEGIDNPSGQMSKVFISDERSTKDPVVIFATSGQLIQNPQRKTLTLRLRNGTLHHNTNDASNSYQTVNFKNYDINLNLGSKLTDPSSRHASDNEFMSGQLIAAIKAQTDPKQALRLSAELHKRFSTTLTPLIFALVGIPLALQSSRSGKGAGFSWALAIALGYYLLLSLFRTLAENGQLPAAISLYLPDIIYLIGGAFAIRAAATERPLNFHGLSLRRLGPLATRRKK